MRCTACFQIRHHHLPAHSSAVSEVGLAQERVDLELENTAMLPDCHAVVHGHHDLYTKETRVLYLKADLDTLIQCSGQKSNVIRVIRKGDFVVAVELVHYFSVVGVVELFVSSASLMG